MRSIGSGRVSIDSIIRVGMSILVCGVFFERLPIQLLGLTIVKITFLTSSFILLLLLTMTDSGIYLPANPYIYAYFGYLVFTLFFNQAHHNISYIASHLQRLLFCIVFLTYARIGASVCLDRILVFAGCVTSVVSLILLSIPHLGQSFGLRDSFVWFGGAQIRRLSGVGNDPNFTALILSISFVALLFRMLIGREKGIMAWVKLTLIGSTFLLTLSRGGMVGLLPGVLLALWSLGDVGTLAKLAVFVIGVALLTRVGDTSSWGIMFSRLITTDVHSESRLQLWKLGIDSLMRGNGCGVGFPAIVFTSEGIGKYIHNTWLEVTVGSGLIGGMLFVLIWIWGLRTALTKRDNSGLLVASIMLVVSIQLTFLSAHALNLLWIVVLLPEAMELDSSHGEALRAD